jgi:hypothetical protein
MQDQQVAFDPMSVDGARPWQLRLFVLYLFVVGVIWIIRSVSLSRQLWFFSRTKRAALAKAGNERLQTDLLAQSALAGKLPREAMATGPSTQYSSSLVEKVESEFLRIWQACSIKAASLKKLFVVTFLVTTLTFAWSATDILAEIGRSKTTGIGAIGGGFAELFAQLTLGTFMCTVLYVTFGFYERVLTRRKLSWYNSVQK